MGYLVRLFYFGDGFHGSQLQPGLRTVQGELISAVEKWSGESHSTSTVRLAGRTDKGVHSIGQIALIDTTESIDIEGINRHLPPDMCIWAVSRAPDEFDPRRDVLMRHYRYVLDAHQIDVRLVQEAAQVLTGYHNYRYLSKPDGDRPTTTTLLSVGVTQTDGLIVIDVFGTSFLWKLVRKAVTLLSRTANREFTMAEVKEIVDGRFHPQGGIAPAPPEALFLVESIVPIRLRPSKRAVKRVIKTMASRVSFLRRSSQALSVIYRQESAGMRLVWRPAKF